MSERSTTTVTALLARARQGDASAVRALFPLVYDQLKKLARGQRRRREEETLNTTALVHEVFLRMAGQEELDLRDRDHFFAVASMAMRQILIDHARRRLAEKRGGGRVIASFEEVEAALGAGADFDETRAEALVAVHEALERLARHSKRQSQVVECRFFGGMSIEECARALDISVATVKRDWAMAQAWLYRDLKTTLG
jgi:RNA polymerase sigma factor (TIGR02999 family)